MWFAGEKLLTEVPRHQRVEIVALGRGYQFDKAVFETGASRREDLAHQQVTLFAEVAEGAG